MDFKDLVQKNKTGILKNIVPTHSKKGEYLIQQGNAALHCFILLEGKVKVFHTTSSGENFLFGIFDQSQIYGHLEIISKASYFNSVQCITDCQFVKLDRDHYLKWLKNDAEFALKIHEDLCAKLLNSSGRMLESNYLPLEYHILKYLIDRSKNFACLEFQINKQELADFLGTKLRSINRILNQMQIDMLIEIQKTQIKIINPEAINTGVKKYF